jgi:hypothetical protein
MRPLYSQDSSVYVYPQTSWYKCRLPVVCLLQQTGVTPGVTPGVALGVTPGVTPAANRATGLVLPKLATTIPIRKIAFMLRAQALLHGTI